LQKCAKCSIETITTYSCEHTGNLETCSECYQRIHWNLTK
jgi:hypothetical protein